MNTDWQAYWSGRTAVADGIDDLLVQAGKTQFGMPVSQDQIELLAGHVADSLGVETTSHGLDLGCGNGLLTARVARRAGQVVGLDYSEAMLANARATNGATNVAYVQADLRDLSNVSLPPGPYGVAWSSEVVQYLDPPSLTRLLRWLVSVMEPELRFLVSGIPDAQRIRNFHNTRERWQRHLDDEAAGRNPMGRWWSRDEFTEVAASVGLAVDFGDLPQGYYTSHYRFDAVFRGSR